jgi:4-amino-4-deoxy-L-arabinose transferase-like glycosyltransferase
MTFASGWPLPTLLLLCFFTFFLGLGRQAITDSDEAYYAEASREMVDGGDWLTPHFNGENRWQKPILYYWLTAATYLVTGPTEFAARLWSALSGVGLVLLTWAIARHLIGRADTAWLAGAIAATTFGYFLMARAALPDLPLTFCVTLVIWSVMRAIGRDTSSSTIGWWALAGLGAALGFLMKGPVALALPALVLPPLVWRERTRVRIDRRGIIAAALVFALIGLPWYIAMWRTHGNAYLQSFFVSDNFERFATERFNDARPWWFYLPVLLGGMLPWSLYLIVECGRGVQVATRASRRLTDVDWRILIWAVVPLLFFTASVGKQPRYILPVLPPLAVFLARAIVRDIELPAERHRATLTVATWATAFLFAGLAFLFIRLEPVLIYIITSATWAGVCLVGCAALVLAWVAVTRAWPRLPLVMTVAATVLLLSVQFAVLTGTRPDAVEEMAALIRAHRIANEPVGVFGVFSRNLGFYTGFTHMDLFDQAHAAAFTRSEERVLLVLRSHDLGAVEAASGMRLHVLGQITYLNVADFRLRTLLRPNPEEVIQPVSLVTNR